MTHQNLVALLQAQFKKMQETGKLFQSSFNGKDCWNMYLWGFENPGIFRDPESNEYKCNCCNSFVKRYGNIVAIDSNYDIMTIWDIDLPQDNEYYKSVKIVRDSLKTSKIANVFVESFDFLHSSTYEKTNSRMTEFQLGIANNYKTYTKEEAEKFGVVEAGKVYQFHHFHLSLSKQFVDFSDNSVEAVQAGHRDAKNVLLRALTEIRLETLENVKEMIQTDALLDGKTHQYKIDAIIPLKQSFQNITDAQRENWAWVNSYNLPFAKFGNELIGQLCYDIQEKGLEVAVLAWNKRVDPANYMKAVAPISKGQREKANKLVAELGIIESFSRRFARIADINIDEIRFTNANSKSKAAGLFDIIAPKSQEQVKIDKDKLQKISIEELLELLNTHPKSIQVMLENRLEGNLVALTTAAVANSPLLFKWDNPFSWTFKGNLAGKSMIKAAVKDAGGRVDGVLRFSMIWNESTRDTSDLDAWCEQSNGEKIGFSTEFRKDRGQKFSSWGGQLDLDNINPGKNIGIENIYFKDMNKLQDGTYYFRVNQYSARNSQGFKAEIEFDGEQFLYEYPQPVQQGANISVATVTVKNGKFSIQHHLPETNLTAKSLWNIETNQFHNCTLVCSSPNHWGNNNVGNKHYLFMLQDCKTNEAIKGFHAENLREDLHEIRKQIDVLGNLLTIEPSEEQLCGLGFNATVRDNVVVKVDNRLFLITI